MSDVFKGVINCAKCGSMNDIQWTACCTCGVFPLQDAEGASFDAAMNASVNSESTAPEPGSCWQHRNGAVYEVLMITNADSAKPEYPPTVVYQGTVNRKLWSRPVADWHRSMTLIKV